MTYLSGLKKLVSMRRSIIMPIYILRGYTQKSNLPIQCAYAGNRLKSLGYWGGLIFRETPDYQLVASCPFFMIRNLIRRRFPLCSLLLIEAGFPFDQYCTRYKSFRIPNAIRTFIDISRPMSELCRNSKAGHENIRRLISKYDLNYKISNTVADCQDFYTNMYIPYIKMRHENRSNIIDYNGIFSDLCPFDLFKIQKCSKTIAGAVVHYRKNRPVLGFFGVREGKFEYVRQGVLGSAYHFVATAMHERGYKELELGDSPPIVSEGITRHKIRLLAKIDPNHPMDLNSCIYLMVISDNAACRDFLSNNPFVFFNKNNELSVAYWVQSGQYSGWKELEKELNLAFRLGIPDCTVFLMDTDNSIAQWCRGIADGRIVVRAASEYL
jgi:hypothetical protein